MTVGTALDMDRVLENAEQLAGDWAGQRAERQRRRHLDPADFERLREAGFLGACLPIEDGGLWVSHQESGWQVFEILRRLAHGDSSVALVAAMHPMVLSTGDWLGSPPAQEPYTEAWEAQCRRVFATAREGAFWGTVISEPGTGGDPALTRATARRAPLSADPLQYRLTGQKQFGSGSGITSFVITTAIPEGEATHDYFFIDMRGVLDQRGVPVADSAGVQLTAAWDGHGMTATQSHALSFEDVPATRLAWPSHARPRTVVDRAAGGGFVAVIVGIVEVAVETARRQLQHKRDSLRSYEQVEWARVETEAWLVQQAYAGLIRASREGGRAARQSVYAKTAIAELAESILTRIGRIGGGGAYSRSSPFGFWMEDVRALGFLRPPWALAFDRMIAASLLAPDE